MGDVKFIQTSAAPEAELRQVAPGVVFELPVIVTVSPVDLGEGTYLVRIVLDQTTDGIRPVQVMVQSQDDDNRVPVTGTALRAVKVSELAREGLKDWALKSDDFSGYVSPPGKPNTKGIGGSKGRPTGTPTDMKRQGPTGEALRWAAYYYNLASVLGLPPLKEVATRLQLSSATAARWVRKAREEGLIVGSDADRGQTNVVDR